MTAVSSLPERSSCAEQRFSLYDLDWAAYRKISDALTGHHLRMVFDQGRLELCKVTSRRAGCGRLIGLFVAMLTEELDLPIMGCGDMTCERVALQCALEADETFYIENESLVRRKEPIDLAVDPPPDLAVEIDFSQGKRSRLGVYAAIGVPEVWRYDGEQLRIHQRGVGGQYAEVERSPHFPIVTGNDMLRFLQQRTQTESNQLMRGFRSWVREQIRARQECQP
jgi:Uma2 family endonuclease